MNTLSNLINACRETSGEDAPTLTANATLFDLGLKTEAALREFATKVSAHFSLSADVLGVDVLAMVPTLSEIEAIVKEALPSSPVATTATTTTKSATTKPSGGLFPIHTMRTAVCLVLLAATTASGTSMSCASRAPSVASLFTYEDFGSYRVVNSTQCGETYVLYPRGTNPPDLGSPTGLKYFATPLQKVVLTQTTPVAFLETIGARDAIAVASQYTTSACVAKGVVDGAKLQYVSHSSNATAHGLLVGDDEYDAIFSDPWGTSSWAHAESANKLICAATTYETAPNGGAEWVKFFGAFFDADSRAQASYCATSSRYSCNAFAASSLAHEADKLGTASYSYQVPTALFASLDWNGNYGIQMTPYKNKLVMDAGATYPDLSAYDAFRTTHWTGAYVSGYTFPPANASQFHAALALAAVVIDESYPNGQTLTTIKTKYGLDSTAAQDLPPAFADGRVYTLDATMDATGAPYGGTDMYEARVAEPDRILSDLIKVLHPSGTDYAPTGMSILRHAATGAITQVDASMCTDATAPRAIHAATCDELAATNDAVLSWLAALDAASAPPSPAPELANEAAAQSDNGLLVVVIALGVVTLGAVVTAAILYKKLAAAAAQPKAAAATSSVHA